MASARADAAAGEVPDAFRDQGFTRPTVLVLLPYKLAALRVVKAMAALLPEAWTPHRVDALESQRVVRVTAGRAHSMCCTDEGKLFVWGAARYGRLGLGELATLARDARGEPYQAEPRLVQALQQAGVRVVGMAAGAAHSLVLCVERGAPWPADASSPGGMATATAAATAAPRVMAWGLASSGRLGLRRGEDVGPDDVAFDAEHEELYVPRPQPVPALDGLRVARVAAGSAHSFAITAGGAAYGWGLASHGRLGLGREEQLPEDDDGDVFVESPTPLRGLCGYTVAAISAGDSHSLALTTRGQLLSWGMANYGRLGFSEGVLRMPRESDGTPYQPLPRQIWAGAVLPAVDHWSRVDDPTMTGGNGRLQVIPERV